MAQPIILLTRPSGQSHRFARLIRERIGAGAQIVIAPVLRIAVRPIAAEVLGAPGFVFTSENGVAAFAAAGGVGDRRPAWCVGERTAAAAGATGLDAVSADGDADALVALLAEARPRGQIAHLHGAHVTGDLAARLGAVGVRVTSVTAYDQTAIGLDRSARRLLSGSAPVIAPVFSSRSARLVAPDLAAATAPLSLAAISLAVAATLADAGSWPLRVAETPDAGAMLTLLADMIGERRT